MEVHHLMTDGKPQPGRLYGVGVGPGDPELITLKAARVLAGVPVIFVPKKANESDSLAEAIISDVVHQSKPEIVGLVFPMTRDKALLAKYWRQAAETFWQHLSDGKDCAFVNLGDPLIYGTFIHVLDTLEKVHPEVDVEVIPGVSSVNAAAARGIVPLAIDDERVAIISSTGDKKLIRQVLESFDTVVFMKANMTFNTVFDILEEMNLTGKCLYARRCTTGDEEIIRDISRLKGQKLDYFSLLIVRK